jgi:hypothetical protein
MVELFSAARANWQQSNRRADAKMIASLERVPLNFISDLLEINSRT